MTTLAERIAALPVMPDADDPHYDSNDAVPDEYEFDRAEAIKARLALAADFIREQCVEGCAECDGKGAYRVFHCDRPDVIHDCPACADARKILEVLK